MWDVWAKALEIASHVENPNSVAALAIVVAAILITIALQIKKKNIIWPSKIAYVLAAGILVLGIAPIAASTAMKFRGIYRIRIVVLDANKLPTDEASVTSSAGGELKKDHSIGNSISHLRLSRPMTRSRSTLL